MNAKFLEKLVQYRNSDLSSEMMRCILNEKIHRQMHQIHEVSEKWLIPKEIAMKKYMLYGARAAHHFW